MSNNFKHGSTVITVVPCFLSNLDVYFMVSCRPKMSSLSSNSGAGTPNLQQRNQGSRKPIENPHLSCLVHSSLFVDACRCHCWANVASCGFQMAGLLHLGDFARGRWSCLWCLTAEKLFRDLHRMRIDVSMSYLSYLCGWMMLVYKDVCIYIYIVVACMHVNICINTLNTLCVYQCLVWFSKARGPPCPQSQLSHPLADHSQPPFPKRNGPACPVCLRRNLESKCFELLNRPSGPPLLCHFPRRSASSSTPSPPWPRSTWAFSTGWAHGPKWHSPKRENVRERY